MHILFTRFPLESALGGAEIQTLSLMDGLRKRGHDVAFLGSCPTLLRECRARGIPCTELQIGPAPVTKWGAVSFAWRKTTMKTQLTRALAQFTTLDAVCMLSLTEKLLLTEPVAEKGTRVLWIEHDRVGRWLTRSPWLSQLRLAANRATTVGVSELSRQVYVDLGWPKETTVAIPNGIALDRFASREKGSTLKTENSSLHLGCVARLSPEKGIDVLLDAVTKQPDVNLTIVGTGREQGYLHTRIQEIQEREHVAEARIRIIPSVPDLGAFYRSIDALVLPSREHDPFGLVAAEAMSVGTPVIVTDACGIAGYLSDGNDALIIAADSAAELSDAINEIRDPTLRKRLSDNGPQTVKEQFTIDRMVDRYEEILSSHAKSAASR